MITNEELMKRIKYCYIWKNKNKRNFNPYSFFEELHSSTKNLKLDEGLDEWLANESWPLFHPRLKESSPIIIRFRVQRNRRVKMSYRWVNS